MKKNNKKGFTLVELVIVVAVMAVLVAVAIPTVSSIVNSAKDSTNDSNARTIESMIKLAEAEADGTAPGAQAVFDALSDAKLGIKDATFQYDIVAGTVEYNTSAATKANETMKIAFDKDGALTVDSITEKTPASSGTGTGTGTGTT